MATTTQEKKPKGVSMDSGNILFAVGVILIIAAVFVYARAENNSFAQLVTTVNDMRGSTLHAAKACTELSEILVAQDKTIEDLKSKIRAGAEATDEALTRSVGPINKEFEIMKVRQMTLEKKLNDTRDIKVSFTQPIEVVTRPRATPGPAKNLLKKSGVSTRATQ